MAQRRMFSKTITNSDSFLEMPDSSQNLYFHLSMNADDDGFVDNWKSIMRMTGHKDDDLKVLIAKQYIIPFDTGVIIIKHWRMNNYLRSDRYKETVYKEELKNLSLDENLVYQMDTNGIHRLGKDRLGKESIDKYIAEQKPLIPYEDIINYLNSKAKTNYKSSTNKTKELIKARVNEGFTLDDFKKVIDKKCNEWIGSEMEKYLRPETLFSNKFESYLNQRIDKKITTKDLATKINFMNFLEEDNND